MAQTLNFRRLPIKSLLVLTLLFAGTGTVLTATNFVNASDHDDGEVDTKGRNLNLTDLYVFREKDQNPQASADDLVFVMNTNPRSVARQQYFFSTRARYQFHVTRVNNKDAMATGRSHMIIRMKFGKPDKNQSQPVTVTVLGNGKPRSFRAQTTPLNQPAQSYQGRVGQHHIAMFAGLREDPFFFDVEQFFRVRAGARKTGPAVGFRDPSKALDFAKGYNVNTVALRVPIKLLQAGTDAKVFDVWQTISLPGRGGRYRQVERLGRPGINEGLIVQNNLLNTLNKVSPSFEAAALAGKQPQAKLAAPVIADASRTLKALGNNDQRTQALLQAFLPDVMRIDTTGKSGYGAALNALGSPIRGRLLKDDVIDTTLSVLTNGAVPSDNVSYEGTPGNTAQGHQPLERRFPYLAKPN
ncbi:DUF4331 domain-containing protein [filamentous cyanobacterium LEGE 11480]|uniref:DUF4331 domain-containing protein n=2 Tax=Romeriopsis TaxID=2992131 RepID=A0A928Z5K4_9CYAN|nr:DUF4331 domain-containing protein [Romeriopsis navalis LEGE 11480]